jgi:hypothetical protein
MSPRTEEAEEVVEKEDDDNEEPQGRTQRSSKKPRLFDESGLTDAERRVIRQSQRTLQQTLRDGEYDTFEELAEVRETNNRMFQSSVRFTREGTSTHVRLDKNNKFLHVFCITASVIFISKMLHSLIVLNFSRIGRRQR